MHRCTVCGGFFPCPHDVADIVTCETTAAISLHARIVTNKRPVRMSGHSDRPRSLCGSEVAWDTARSLSCTTCGQCVDIVRDPQRRSIARAHALALREPSSESYDGAFDDLFVARTIAEHMADYTEDVIDDLVEALLEGFAKTEADIAKRMQHLRPAPRPRTPIETMVDRATGFDRERR
jgi:hypothetical protein